MFKGSFDGSKKISYIIFSVLLIAFLLFLEYFEYIGEDSWFWVFILIDFCFELIFSEKADKKETAKKFYYKKYLLGDSVFEQFDFCVGKEVKIKTLDEVINGIVKNVDNDFIVVEKNKKNLVETVYVNKNAIQTVKIIKLK